MSLNSTAGDSAAESFASVAEADAYFAARGNTTWTGATPAKENALRVGSGYLCNQYRDRWVGITATQAQALAWPRVDGARSGYYQRGFTQSLLDLDGWPIAQDVVPVQVKNANIEAALLALTGVSLEPRLVRGNAIKSTHSKVDVLEKEIVYQDGAPVVDRFLVIEGLLRGLVTSFPGAPSGNVRMVRS